MAARVGVLRLRSLASLALSAQDDIAGKSVVNSDEFSRDGGDGASPVSTKAREDVLRVLRVSVVKPDVSVLQ